MSEKLLYFKSWLASKYINLLGSKPSDPKTILVVKLDEIGDMVTALHVFYNLHTQFPNASIDLLCRPVNTIFFRHLSYVTCINELPKGTEPYDVIVELRGDRNSLRYALANRPGYRVDRGSIRMRNKFVGGQRNELITNAQIIQPLLDNTASLDHPIVLGNDEHQRISELIAQENIEPFALLHLGARDASRRWPIERFAEIVNYLNTQWNMGAVLVGGTDDVQRNNECLSLVKQKTNISVAGTLNLLEYAALCERASLFVGNESGPVHIASAQKTPLVALFGPGVKNVFYPLGPKVRIHHYFLARGHKKQTLENSTIFHIKVDEVKESIDDLLQHSA